MGVWGGVWGDCMQFDDEVWGAKDIIRKVQDSLAHLTMRDGCFPFYVPDAVGKSTIFEKFNSCAGVLFFPVYQTYPCYTVGVSLVDDTDGLLVMYSDGYDTAHHKFLYAGYDNVYALQNEVDIWVSNLFQRVLAPKLREAHKAYKAKGVANRWLTGMRD